jgi:hypothetical protein
MNFKQILYYFYLTITIIILHFTTIFWIGTEEDFYLLKQNWIVFFISRFILNLIFIAFFLLVLFICKLFFKKDGLSKKLFLRTFYIYIIASIFFIIYIHFLPR